MQSSSIMKDTYHMKFIISYYEPRANGSASKNCINEIGDSDVGDFMMVIDLRCWWHNHYVGDFFRYVGHFLMYTGGRPFRCIKSVTKISNLSPTHFVFNIRHQHRCHHEIAVSDGAIYNGRHRIGNRSAKIWTQYDPSLAYNIRRLFDHIICIILKDTYHMNHLIRSILYGR